MFTDICVLILAAGRGTRLGALTSNIPKPLVKVGAKMLVERHLENLSSLGLRQVVINTHYLAEVLRDALGDGSRWKLQIEYSDEERLLDTGGAIKKIAPIVGERRLVTINADSLFMPKLDLGNLLSEHSRFEQEPFATMLLSGNGEASTYGALRMNTQGRISKFLREEAFDIPPSGKDYIYTGVQVLSNRAVKQIAQGKDVFSVTRDFLAPAMQKECLRAVLSEATWFDVGTPERLARAESFLGSSDSK